jgi:hypothetical protein
MAPTGKSRFDAFAISTGVAAARGSTSPQVLAKLAKRPEPEIRAAVIANPEAPVEVVGRLIDEADCIITEFTLSEESLPLQIALKFAVHPHWFVRAAAARSLGAPVPLLNALAGDSVVDVQLEVAQNLTAPPALLIDLAQEPTDAIRETVALNPSAPAEALWRLTADTELAVRSAVARRPHLSADLFRALSQDRHERIRCILSENETLSESELECLSQDSSDQVRCIVATRRLDSAEWVAKMPQESVLQARRAAAYQPKTAAEILKGLKLEVLDSDEQSPRVAGENHDDNVRSRRKCQQSGQKGRAKRR